VRALLWKELRQVLPAQLLVALVLAGIGLRWVPPSTILLPSKLDFINFNVLWLLICVANGLVVGFVQHARERTAGTEAYLVHRATGHRRPFLAKVLAAGIAIAAVVAIPVSIYAVWHLVLSVSIKDGLTGRLWTVAWVGACSLPGYGMGVLVAQLRKSLLLRAGLAVAGGVTILTAAALASRPWPDTLTTSKEVFGSFQVLATLGTLGIAYLLHRAGEDEGRPWPPQLGSLVAWVSVAAFWLPIAWIVAGSQQSARYRILAAYPEIVEDSAANLYLVLDEWDSWGTEPVALQRADGSILQLLPGDLGGIFDAEWTALQQTHPIQGIVEASPISVLEFDGPWVPLGWPSMQSSAELSFEDIWFGRTEGHLYWVNRKGEGPQRLVRLGKGLDNDRFSERTVVTFLWPTIEDAFSFEYLVDLEDLTIWRPSIEGMDPLQLLQVQLPEDDSLAALERTYDKWYLRVGIYKSSEPNGWILVGKQKRYATPLGDPPEVLPHDLPESQAAAAKVWRMEPSRIDGLAFHLEIVDAKSRERAFAHDFCPSTKNQKQWAGVAWLLTLARPPIGSLWSWLGAEFDPRDIRRATTHVFVDPLLLGGSHPGLFSASLALGVVLAWRAGRRLGNDPRERATRWTWTALVFALGLPAWCLFRLLEPSRRVLAERSKHTGSIASALIVTPRQRVVLKPTLRGA
jgi:hypothetical protein